MKYIINSNENEKTIKEILNKSIGLSKAFIKHLKFIDNGILLNGNHATVRKIVYEGDILTLATEDTDMGQRLTPADIPLDIIFEDEFVIIPSKPPFMPTHPSHLHHGDTLADALAFRYKNQNKPFVFRPVNRLDRNTSGLTIIAKDRISASALANSMSKGLVKKQYIALLCGELPLGEGQIETHLRRSTQSIIIREICSSEEGGDYSLTKYKVLMSKNGYSLVAASPITGRTHQLRVHFASIGCPIVGDELYGTPSEQISRQALHASNLMFPHPKTNEYIKLSSPLPKDILSLCRSLFGEEQKAYNFDFELNI